MKFFSRNPCTVIGHDNWVRFAAMLFVIICILKCMVVFVTLPCLFKTRLSLRMKIKAEFIKPTSWSNIFLEHCKFSNETFSYNVAYKVKNPFYKEN